MEKGSFSILGTGRPDSTKVDGSWRILGVETIFAAVLGGEMVFAGVDGTWGILWPAFGFG